jgi:hypothetical protein
MQPGGSCKNGDLNASKNSSLFSAKIAALSLQNTDSPAAWTGGKR